MTTLQQLSAAIAAHDATDIIQTDLTRRAIARLHELIMKGHS